VYEGRRDGAEVLAKPGKRRHHLHVKPAPANWDKAGSPGKVCQEAFIDDAYSVVTDSVQRPRTRSLSV
jgi:hypothetical protein